MADKRSAPHTFGTGQQDKLDFMVGDRVDGQLVQLGFGGGESGEALRMIAMLLSDLYDEQLVTNELLQEILR